MGLIIFGCIFGAMSAITIWEGFVLHSILYLLISSLFFCTGRIVVAIEGLKEKN